MSSLKVRKIPTNKSKIKQTPNANRGLIPSHPFRWYICGASGSGKTNLLLTLLTSQAFYKNYFDIFIISPTAGGLDDSYTVLALPPEKYFYPDFRVLERIFELQKISIDRKKGVHKCKPAITFGGTSSVHTSTRFIRDAVVALNLVCTKPICDEEHRRGLCLERL